MPSDEWWADERETGRAAWIEEQMRLSSSYLTSESLTVQCATMNCAAREVPSISDSLALSSFRQWLTHSVAGITPDLIVIGLQEMVSLDNPWNTVVSPELSSSMQARKWADFLSAAVNPHKGDQQQLYALEHMSHLVGMCLIVFSHAITVHPHVSDVRSVSVGTGLWGAGNKGGQTFSMCIHDTSVSFTNLHLAAGRGNTERRNADFQSVLSQTKLAPTTTTTDTQTNPILWVLSPVLSIPSTIAAPSSSSAPTGLWHARTLWAQGGPKSIFHHEVSVVLGDLNYHVINPEQAEKGLQHEEQQQQQQQEKECLILDSLAQENCPASTLLALLPGDQLLTEMEQGRVLSGFTEAPITFLPTYRLRPARRPGGDQFVHDELRFPAWTDRILYRCLDEASSSSAITPTLRPVAYSSTQQPLNNSDHAAVSLSLFATVRRVDAAIEAQCLDDVLAQLQAFEARMRPCLELDHNVVVGELQRKRAVRACVRMRNTQSAVPAHWRLFEVGRTKISPCSSPEGGAEGKNLEVETTWLTFPYPSGTACSGRGSMSSVDGTLPPEGCLSATSQSETLLMSGRLDGKTARALRALGLPSSKGVSQVVLTCICVLQVKGGSDHYITISGTYCVGEKRGGRKREEKAHNYDDGISGSGAVHVPSSDEDEDDKEEKEGVTARRQTSPDRGSKPSSLVSITSDGTTSVVSTGSSQLPTQATPLQPPQTPQKAKDFVCFSPTSWW